MVDNVERWRRRRRRQWAEQCVERRPKCCSDERDSVRFDSSHVSDSDRGGVSVVETAAGRKIADDRGNRDDIVVKRPGGMRR